jgi:hypothetical protein
VSLFELNEARLFMKTPAEKPDFELSIPEGLTKRIYIRIVKKIFAVIRFQIYSEIRNIIRSRPASPG